MLSLQLFFKPYQAISPLKYWSVVMTKSKEVAAVAAELTEVQQLFHDYDAAKGPFEEVYDEAGEVASTVTHLEAYNRLSTLARRKVDTLYASMTAVPEGMEELNVRWRPEELKLFHPVSTDEMAPGDVRPGDIYSQGEMLWSKKVDGVDKPFKFVLCHAWKSRARFQDGERTPDCKSDDLIHNVYGTMLCQNCPDLPFHNGLATNCQDTWNMVLLPLDMQSIYVARFSKSSAKAGSNIAKILTGSKKSWEKAFGLYSKEMERKNNKWNAYQSVALSSVEVAPEVKLFAGIIAAQMLGTRKSLLTAQAGMRDSLLLGADSLKGIAADVASDDEGFEDSM